MPRRRGELRDLAPPGFARELALRVPRLGRAQLLDHLWPGPRPALQLLDASLLCEAAAAAFGLSTLLRRGAVSGSARLAALHAALQANPTKGLEAEVAAGQSAQTDWPSVRRGVPEAFPHGALPSAITGAALEQLLGMRPRSLRRGRAQACDPALVRRVMRQWTLRSYVRLAEQSEAA